MLCEMCGAGSAVFGTTKISGSVLVASCAGMGKQTTYRESVGHRAFVAQTLEERAENEIQRHII